MTDKKNENNTRMSSDDGSLQVRSRSKKTGPMQKATVQPLSEKSKPVRKKNIEEQLIQKKHESVQEQSVRPAADRIEDPEVRFAEEKKKKNSGKKKAVKAISIVLTVFVVLAAGGYGVFHYFYSQLNYVPSEENRIAENASYNIDDGEQGDPALELSDEEYDSLKAMLDNNIKSGEFVMQDENVWNVLLIGADYMEGSETGHSDSMILVSVSKWTKSIVMTSLMRDIYLKVADYGYGRINEALPSGGVSRLVDTIEQNFGIHVDNYAMVDFLTFEQVIDKLGGIYVTPTKVECDYINSLFEDWGCAEYSITYTGELTKLNGVQALYYARIRAVGNSDYDRTARQRKVLLAAKERVLSMDLTELLEMVTTFLPDVTTDVDEAKCISLLFSGLDMLKNYEIKELRIPMDGTMDEVTIRGNAVLRIDFDANVQAWKDLVYGNFGGNTISLTEAVQQEDFDDYPAYVEPEEDEYDYDADYDSGYDYDYDYNSYDTYEEPAQGYAPSYNADSAFNDYYFNPAVG